VLGEVSTSLSGFKENTDAFSNDSKVNPNRLDAPRGHQVT
jgi:hypothetical protein